MAAFVVRLVLYAVVFGITSRIAQTLWTSRGLDGVADAAPVHDLGTAALAVAPVVFALIGVGRLRPIAIALAGVVIGAALTAPFALARLAAGG